MQSRPGSEGYDSGVKLFYLIVNAKHTANTKLVQQVTTLLEAGADTQIYCYEKNESTLHKARYVQDAQQRQAIIKLLLKHGADPNKRSRYDASWTTPVGEAGLAIDWETVITYATAPKAPNMIAPTPITLGAALWDALRFELTEDSRKAANILLDAGADVNQAFGVAGVKKSTFQGIGACSDSEIISKLLQRGVKINYKDSENKTAIQRLREANKKDKILLIANIIKDHKEFYQARLNMILFQRAYMVKEEKQVANVQKLPVTVMTYMQKFLFPFMQGYINYENETKKSVYTTDWPKIQLAVKNKRERAQQESKKIALFKKIYAALREGQKSGIMPKTCYQWDKNLDPVTLADQITAYANENANKESRTAIAWALAEEFKTSNADGNLTLPLFEKIYEKSFSKSSYFSKSNLLSTSHCFGFTYFSKSLKKQIDDNQITQAKVDAIKAKNPDSRTASIYRAFGGENR